MEWTPQIALWLEQLDLNLDSINWQQVLTEVASFLQNGAGNVLSTTVNVAARSSMEWSPPFWRSFFRSIC